MTTTTTSTTIPESAIGGALREEVLRHRASLLERLQAGEDGIALGRSNAAFLDRLMKALFEQVSGQNSQTSQRGRDAEPMPELAAVGSFGRGAVALRSDADVRLLVSPRGKAREQGAKLAEALLYPLWDAALSIGHQVMDATEALNLAQSDLATATAILDLRHLAGDPSMVLCKPR